MVVLATLASAFQADPPIPTPSPIPDPDQSSPLLYLFVLVFKLVRNVLSLLYPGIVDPTPAAAPYVEGMCSWRRGMGAIVSIVVVILLLITLVDGVEHFAEPARRRSNGTRTHSTAWAGYPERIAQAAGFPPAHPNEERTTLLGAGPQAAEHTRSIVDSVLHYTGAALQTVLILTGVVHVFRLAWGLTVCIAKAAWDVIQMS